MHADEAIQIFSKMYNQLGPKWAKLIDALKAAADPENQSQIYVEDFLSICKKFGVKLKEDNEQAIIMAFPGEEGERGPKLNIARIFDLKYVNALQ